MDSNNLLQFESHHKHIKHKGEELKQPINNNVQQVSDATEEKQNLNFCYADIYIK
jgi:hypothetical protein